MRLWRVVGKGRCAGTITLVLAESAELAIRKLTADCFSPYYEWLIVERWLL